MGFLAKKVWITNAAKTILGTTAQTVEDALITLKNNVLIKDCNNFINTLTSI